MTNKCLHIERYEKTTRPSGASAGRHKASAIAYRNAAKQLFDSGDATLTGPGYFALAHSIELFLKAFLLAKGVSPKTLSGKIGHCLECLWGLAAEKGLAISGYDMPSIAHHLTPYSEIHRYPDFDILDVIRAEELLNLSWAIQAAVHDSIMRAHIMEFGKGNSWEVDKFTHFGDKK